MKNNFRRCFLFFFALLPFLPMMAPAENFIFTNAAPVYINDAAVASPYPSAIAVSGLNGRSLVKVTVTLNGLTHEFADHLDILLVGPAGQNLLLMSDAGGNTDIKGAVLTFDDDALMNLPNANAITTATYRPSNYGGAADVFPAPAPAVSSATNLSVFQNSNLDGIWSLYVVDDNSNRAGIISGGWSLTFTTGGYVSAGPVAITNSATVPTPAAVYPSTVLISGLAGVITKVSVTLNNFTHHFPDDVDMLLVSPTGTNLFILSDVGGATPVTNLNIVLDDSGSATIPDTGPMTNGIFKPSIIGTGDTFPAPAPPVGVNTAFSIFNGSNPNGTWKLFIVDDAAGDEGSLSNWTLNIQTTALVTQPGDLLISEFRLRGLNGTNDEFIEIINPKDVDHVVNPFDGSAGYALATSNGVTRFIIPSGTLIPAHSHYLAVNSLGYSLSNYPAGSGVTATGNISYATDIPDTAGLALFRTAIQTNFVLTNRLDAVGSTIETNSLYKEGAGFVPVTSNADHSFSRALTNGIPKDTGNNATDFVFADTQGTFISGLPQRLGAPGPKNLSSPVFLLKGASLVHTLIDPGSSLSSPTNKLRDLTSNPGNNSTFGTLSLRRKFTNLSGHDISRLRFRIASLTTFPDASTIPGSADMRAVSSTNFSITVNGSNLAVRGTILEQPASQPNGGGLNSTFSVTNITAASPLTNGGSVYVQFLFGLQGNGNYRVALLPETFPGTAGDTFTIFGNTQSVIDTEATNAPVLASIRVGALTDPKVLFSTIPGRMYQMERNTNLVNGTWIDTDVPFSGTGFPLEATHLNGTGADREFYRVRVVP